MIQANELRIGNYFKWISTDEIEVVKDITGRKKYPSVNNVNLTDAIGIPLTEDILLKCGFVPFNYSDKEKGFIIENEKASKSIYIRTYAEPNISGFFNVFNRSECNWQEIQFISKVKYIHQLQNLYFAFTQQELNIKL